MGLLNGIADTDAPLQTVRLFTELTTGDGFTVTLKLVAGPVQPFAVPVTVSRATTGETPALTAVKEAILPVPLVPNPTLTVLV
ncbi:hypothetical protein GCM10023187_57150 [Nibrella viscosa]|uniref:Uncharacterized protein n=1 Tax=Nibrella viscosa TaxID=1084524 RepID=A0ABP8L276_9BACT